MFLFFQWDKIVAIGVSHAQFVVKMLSHFSGGLIQYPPLNTACITEHVTIVLDSHFVSLENVSCRRLPGIFAIQMCLVSVYAMTN